MKQIPIFPNCRRIPGNPAEKPRAHCCCQLSTAVFLESLDRKIGRVQPGRPTPIAMAIISGGVIGRGRHAGEELLWISCDLGHRCPPFETCNVNKEL